MGMSDFLVKIVLFCWDILDMSYTILKVLSRQTIWHFDRADPSPRSTTRGFENLKNKKIKHLPENFLMNEERLEIYTPLGRAWVAESKKLNFEVHGRRVQSQSGLGR